MIRWTLHYDLNAEGHKSIDFYTDSEEEDADFREQLESLKKRDDADYWHTFTKPISIDWKGRYFWADMTSVIAVNRFEMSNEEIHAYRKSMAGDLAKILPMEEIVE